MTYIPLLAFGLAVGWMIWRGHAAKEEYLRLRRRLEENENNSKVPEDRAVDALKAQGRGQHQQQEYSRVAGFGQSRGSS